MTIDYIVASLPALTFGAPAPISWADFTERVGTFNVPSEWEKLETALRNAMVEARGGNEKFLRECDLCTLYWKNRVIACFQEADVLKREEMLDKVWWDAAGEITPPSEPLGKRAIVTYALRLKIALKRDKIAKDAGNAAFDRLTAETRINL